MTSQQRKRRLRWLYSCEQRSLNASLAYEKRELATWYRTEYKKYLNEFGQEIADILLA